MDDKKQDVHICNNCGKHLSTDYPIYECDLCSGDMCNHCWLQLTCCSFCFEGYIRDK